MKYLKWKLTAILKGRFYLLEWIRILEALDVVIERLEEDKKHLPT